MTDVKLEDAERVADELELISDDEMALGWEPILSQAATLLRKIPDLQRQISQRWLPIEDAPSNVKVLLCGPHGVESGYASTGWPRKISGVSNLSYHGWATHWQSLPEAPQP